MKKRLDVKSALAIDQILTSECLLKSKKKALNFTSREFVRSSHVHTVRVFGYCNSGQNAFKKPFSAYSIRKGCELLNLP